MVLLMNFIHASDCPLLWWLYDDNTAWHMLSHLQNSLNFWNEVCVHGWNYLWGSLYLEQSCTFLLDYLYWILHLSHDRDLAVVTYNTKIMLGINCKDVRSYRFPWLPWYTVWHCFALWSCSLEIKACGEISDCFFCVSIKVDPTYGLVPAALSSLCLCDLIAAV